VHLLVKGNFDVIKMHGTTIKIIHFYLSSPSGPSLPVTAWKFIFVSLLW